jgi:hypothetical protein
MKLKLNFLNFNHVPQERLSNQFTEKWIQSLPDIEGFSRIKGQYGVIMTRQSKKGERRAQSPRKHRRPQPKTGPKKDNLLDGYREHANAVPPDLAKTTFIPNIQ